MERLSGCTCRQVKITTTGEPDRVGICHCLNCRKHHGAVFYAAAIFTSDAVSIIGDTQHLDGRHFCQTCGSSVFAVSDHEVEIHLGAFDLPNQFIPTYETWVSRRETWLLPIAGAAQYERNRD